MTLIQAPPPAFGTATLSNCEREQIHLAASIQPHGALLLASQPDGRVLQASANATEFLGIAGGPLGRTLRDLGGNLWPRVRPHFSNRLDAIPVAVRCHLDDPRRPLNALSHPVLGGALVVELERAGPAVDFLSLIHI